MPKKANPSRKNTTISISKNPTKLNLDKLRKKDPTKNSNESDNSVLERILPIFIQEHSELVHNPISTYTDNPSVTTVS